MTQFNDGRDETVYVIQIFLAPDPVSGEHPYVLVKGQDKPFLSFEQALNYLARVRPGETCHGYANYLTENARGL